MDLLHSAEKSTFVLPAVSQVLKKFLSPIAEISQASSLAAQTTTETPKGHPKLKLYKQESEKEASKESPDGSGSDSESNENPEKPRLKLVENPLPPVPSLADIPTILQIFARVRSQREAMMRWFGIKFYRTAVQDQKKAAHFEKGTILDQTAG